MALSLSSIANYLFKRANSKSSTSDGRQFFEEPFDGRAPVLPAQLWAQADQIPMAAPALADGVTSGVVKRYVQAALTAVPGTTNAFQSDSLRNCIPFNFASDGSYNYQLFDSTGASIPFGAGDWLVDPAVGTVTFYGTVPGNMPPKISFFQYVGSVGMVALNPTSLTFKQLATPPTAPSAGFQTIFIGTDGKMKTIDSGGAVKALGGGGGGAAGKNYLADYYDGSSVTGITMYNQVSSYVIASASNLVDTLGDVINYPGNTFYTGQTVMFTTTGTAIGGLTPATNYFAVRINANVFGLATTLANAQSRILIDLTSQGSGNQSFVSSASGVSGGSGTASAGITASVNTTLPLRSPSNVRLSKDASNRLGQNWAIPLSLDRADVDPGRPLKLAFKFRTSANYQATAGAEDACVQLYDLDNNLVVPLDTLFQQPIPVSLTTTGMQFQFQPNRAGYNLAFIIDINSINSNAYDLDLIDMEISSAAGSVPGVFASPLRLIGSMPAPGITSGTAATFGTATVNKLFQGRSGDSQRLSWQGQFAAGTTGTTTSDYLWSLPSNTQFDPARVTFNIEQVNNGQAIWNSRNAFVAGSINDASSNGVLFVLPYDATRFRLGIVWSNSANSSRGIMGGTVFSLGAAFSISLDVLLPVLGWDSGPTYSTSEVALKNQPTSATSSVKTGTLTAAYMSMTGNALALQPGTYDLGGTVDFNNSGTSPAYTNVTMGWYAANGADTTTVPAALTTLSGVTILGGTSNLVQPLSGAVATLQAPELTIRVTQTTTIYLVPMATATTIANARVTTYALANKRPDYSAFGVYGQVDIRNNGSNATLPFYQIVTNGVWFPMTAASLNFLDLPVGTWRLMFQPYFGSQSGQNANYQNIAWAFGAATGSNTSTRPSFPNTLPNVIQLNYMNDFASKDSGGTAEIAAYPIWMTVRVTSGVARIYGDCYAAGTNLGQGRIQPFMMAEKLQ